jgi:hypothetical protein
VSHLIAALCLFAPPGRQKPQPKTIPTLGLFGLLAPYVVAHTYFVDYIAYLYRPQVLDLPLCGLVARNIIKMKVRRDPNTHAMQIAASVPDRRSEQTRYHEITC